MKKIIYSSLILVSIFFVIDKVSAFELIEPSALPGLYSSSSLISENFNLNATKVPTNLTYGTATYNYLKNTFLPSELYKAYGEYYFCFAASDAYAANCLISNNIDSFGIGLNTSNKYLTLWLEPISETDVYNYIISSGKKSSNSAYFTSRKSISNILTSSNYFRTNIPYFKMIDPNYATIVTSDGYYFNNGDILFYLDGDTYVLNTEYKTSLTPEPNIFEEEIDDINYSKMIFNFDVEVLASRDYVFDGIFDFSTIGFINNGVLDDSFGDGGTFLEPYLEYTLTDGSKGTIKIFNYDDGKLQRFAWYGTYQDTVSSDITSLRLIIPMESTVEVRYAINLVSFIPFEVSYELDSTLEDYYERIDLVNKYGIVFMPKLVSNNSYVNSPIDIVGIDQVLVYDTYDYKSEPIYIYDDLGLYFSYNFSLDNLNHNLFFKVKSSSNLAFVRYDTRYYTYKIVDSKYSVGTVINPNTDENHYIDFSNTSDVSSNFSNISDVFEFISEQLDEQNESYILFQNTINSFFNTMPSDLYVVILTLFAIILLGVTLGLGGWR